MAVIFTLILLAALAGIVKPYIGGLKRAHFAIVAVVAFVLVGVTAPDVKQSAGETKSASSAPSATQPGNATAAAAKVEAAPVKWAYSEDKDEMRGDTTRYAVLDSDNQIDLEFPYGEVRGHVTVRHRKQDGLNVMFSVDKGQILCNNFTDTHISAKFDDKPIQRFACTGTSDGSSETAFITDEARFLKQLRTATRTIVEAEFYQQGRQQFTFETRGLEWK